MRGQRILTDNAAALLCVLRKGVKYRPSNSQRREYVGVFLSQEERAC